MLICALLKITLNSYSVLHAYATISTTLLSPGLAMHLHRLLCVSYPH